jgi:hypothetical protein
MRTFAFMDCRLEIFWVNTHFWNTENKNEFNFVAWNKICDLKLRDILHNPWGNTKSKIITIITMMTMIYLHGTQSYYISQWYSRTGRKPPAFWNLKVHYCVHQSPPPVPILSQINWVHAYTHTRYFHIIHSNIILPSTLCFLSGSIPSVFPTKIVYVFLFYRMKATRVNNLIFLVQPF